MSDERRVSHDYFMAKAMEMCDVSERVKADIRPQPSHERDDRIDVLVKSGLNLPADDEDSIADDAIFATLALRATQEFLDSDQSFVLLSGPTGRGKSIACGWVVSRCGGLAITGPELVRVHAAAAWDRSAQDLKDRLYAGRLVVLDELARDDEPLKHEKTAVFGLINARQGRGKRTLITTNRSPQELEARYDEFTFNRIPRQGKVVLLDGEPDYRLLATQRRQRRQVG